MQIVNPAVKKVFDAYPGHVRPYMMKLRQLIFDTAAEIDEVGRIEETLKWGEPSYLTSETQSGSTIRIDWKKRDPEHYGMYFICRTNLVSTFTELYADQLHFEGNRRIVFNIGEEIPTPAVAHCISMALTYHLRR